MTSKTIYHYGMYTDAGNELISDIVATAKRAGLKWRVVRHMLSAVAQDECYAEAIDTAVSEYVYEAMDYMNSDIYS